MVKIQGAKGGGGGGHTPVESPDSLLAESTAKILLAISEGEIAGGLDETRVFLDDTPIANADGSKNFEGVTLEFRPGSEHQEYIQGIPSVDNEIAVGIELKDDQPYVRSINNTQLSAVRVRFSVPQLLQQHDNGDTTGYRIDYVIELSTDGSGYKEIIKSAFDGKTTSEYQRSHRIDLPKANTGWQVRVRRLTKNQNNARIADKISIAAITEVIDAKLRYPNTALLFITFNARQFNNRIPKISVRPKGGILVKVPTNYDPINRTYSGVWDGTFKLAATNNPAWVFYDLVLNNRYGCGDRIKASQIEKWDLYKIAQYCDELVPDGRGGDGKEPRFLCDVYIQSQETAYTVLRDIAAIFRGMTFWADNKVNAVADMPEPIFRTFTNANIVGGKPAYSGGSIQNRYTQALVSFTDIDNHSNDDVEAVADLKLQRRYGVRKTELSAIGCTRRSEANRRGRWALLTNANDRMVTFATGLEGAIPSPGHIIGLADSTLAGRDTGGRISAVDGRKITLDRTTSIKAGDRLIVNLPDGKSEGRTVTSVNQKVVTVSVEYSQAPQKEAVWVVDSDDLAIQLYRVVNINDNGDNTYTISGVIHNPDNYDHIDAGARIDERPITVIPPKVQPAPKNVRISSYTQVDQGIAFTTLRVDWEAAESAIAYEAEWRRDNGNWINAPRTSTLGFEVNGIYAGRYQVRVRAINASEISSVWANAEETQLNGKEGNPPKPLNLRATSEVWGITLNWGFDANTSDTLKTELQYSSENTTESMQLLADVPYPLKSYRMSGLKAGARFYFRARLVDKTGNQSEWTSVVLGESSTDVEGILDAVGDTFLTNEAGQKLQEQIDFNQSNVQLQLEQAAEATLNNTVMLNQVSFRLLEEEGTRRSEIFRLEQVRISDQEALARWQQQVKTDYEQTSSAVLKVQESVSTLEKSTAKDISQVKAEIKQVDDKLGPMDARITDQSEAIAKVDETQTKHIETAESRFTDNEALINQLSRSLANAESSLAEMGMQLTAEYGNQATEQLRIKASITRLDTVTANKFQAFAQSIEKLETQFDDVNSSITTLKKTVSDNEKSQAEINELIKSEIGENKAAIEKRAETSVDQQGNSRAYFSIKAGVLHNGQYYDVKMMMSAQVKNGQVVTQIAFAADEFIIFNNANGQFVTPFAVVNGQVFIGSGFIQDGSITNAKIGNVIQSDNYKAGEVGWHINKNGFTEFQNIKARGEINATSGIFNNVVIAKNCDVHGTIYAENIKGNIVSVTKDIYINKSWFGSHVVELFKVKKRSQKCHVWVQGALTPINVVPGHTGFKTPNRAAMTYRAPSLGNNMGLCDIYVDGIKQNRPNAYLLESDFYALNEFVVDVPSGDGESSIGISIPQFRNETTRFIMRARVIVFPSTDEVIY
ncbi:TipJ family phage tail tip protein [Providencia sp. CRPN26109]